MAKTFCLTPQMETVFMLISTASLTEYELHAIMLCIYTTQPNSPLLTTSHIMPTFLTPLCCSCVTFIILQGETFEVAEVVPFRLTHNMVHALVRG